MEFVSGQEIWDAVGPAIMTVVILIIVGVILAITVKRLDDGPLRRILVRVLPIVLAFTVLWAMLYYSGLWGSR